MIINWIKKNFADYPKFYQNYLKSFKTKNSLNQFIVFDLETLNSNKELLKINRIFAYKVFNQEIILNEFIDLIIDNKINYNEKNKIVIEEAIIQFINFIKNTPLISYQINDKIELINQILKNIEAGKIENEIFDLEILFKTQQKTNLDNFSLKRILEILKFKDYNQDNFVEKVFYKTLIFIKLNKTLKIEQTIK